MSEDEADSTSSAETQNELTTPSGPRQLVFPSILESTSTHGRRGKKRRKTSWIWNHFETQGDKVICMECAASNDADPAKFSSTTSTGNLRSHLLKIHSINNNNDTSDLSQTTLSAQAVVQRRDTFGNEALKKVTTALSRLIVDAKLPFNVVENKAFRLYAQSMNSRVPTYSRRTIVRCIEDEYEATTPKIKAVLQNVKSNIALTCDGWSSRVYRGYFVVTAHWITETFESRNIVLEFVYFPEPHNQWTTKALLLRIMYDFQIQHRVTSITSDNGSEMIAAIEHVRQELNTKYNRSIPDQWHIRCICHIIHRAVTDALEPLKSGLCELRELLKGIRFAKKNRELFKEAQILLNKPTVKDVPGLDVENRWSSLFLMIENCIELKDIFESVCADENSTDAIRNKNLNDESWTNIEAIATFLKPFAEATEIGSNRSNSTVSMIPRIYTRLMKHCTNAIVSTQSTHVIRVAAAAMRTKLKKYEKNWTSEHVQICAALNPRLPKKETDYRADKSASNVIEWWGREGRHKYPKISLLAQNTLMTMGSSVASESTFSDSGAMVRADRTRLSDAHIRILVCLRSWNRFLGYC